MFVCFYYVWGFFYHCWDLNLCAELQTVYEDWLPTVLLHWQLCSSWSTCVHVPVQ